MHVICECDKVKRWFAAFFSLLAIHIWIMRSRPLEHATSKDTHCRCSHLFDLKYFQWKCKYTYLFANGRKKKELYAKRRGKGYGIKSCRHMGRWRHMETTRKFGTEWEKRVVFADGFYWFSLVFAKLYIIYLMSSEQCFGLSFGRSRISVSCVLHIIKPQQCPVRRKTSSRF